MGLEAYNLKQGHKLGYFVIFNSYTECIHTDGGQCFEREVRSFKLTPTQWIESKHKVGRTSLPSGVVKVLEGIEGRCESKRRPRTTITEESHPELLNWILGEYVKKMEELYAADQANRVQKEQVVKEWGREMANTAEYLRHLDSRLRRRELRT